MAARDEWKQYTTDIEATGGDKNGVVQLCFSEPGIVMLDMVSLFPPTFMNRENGMRQDLAQMFANLNPASPADCGIYRQRISERSPCK